MSRYSRLRIFWSCLFACQIFAFFQNSAAFQADPQLLKHAKALADISMRQAWENGTTGEEQPIIKLVGQDGTIVLAQNAPRRFIPLPDGTFAMSAANTTITIIPPTASRASATTGGARDAGKPAEFRMEMNGTDQIQTMMALPSQLSPEQADAIRHAAATGAALAQQRFAIEQFRIQADTEQDYLRITRNFTLYGVIVSIPFLLTIYWIAKHAASGMHSWQKEDQEYRLRQQQAEHEFTLKELQSAERVIAASDEKYAQDERTCQTP